MEFRLDSVELHNVTWLLGEPEPIKLEQQVACKQTHGGVGWCEEKTADNHINYWSTRTVFGLKKQTNA